MKKFLVFLLFVCFGFNVFSQSEEDKANAYRLGLEAIDLMDNGKIDESITLLEEAQKLDPKNFLYPYEIGYAYYLKEDYAKSIEIYKKVIKMKGSDDQSYQMLGNAYDMNGQPEKAIATYNKGLKKFPNSGKLYLELGNMNQKSRSVALEYYEKGIEVDPAFPSNYYWASKMYCNSTEEVWGLIYGEIFINIERNSKRTAEISKLLYKTYKSEISFKSDSTIEVSFSQYANIIITQDKGTDSYKLPYGLLIYEPVMMLSLIGEESISLASLNRIRNTFISLYWQMEHNTKYPNVLFDFHKQLIDLGYFEAYNYWIFMKGDEKGFKTWQQENEDEWNNFVDWFIENPLLLDKEKRFHRLQY